MEQLIFSCRKAPENTTGFAAGPFDVFGMDTKPVDLAKAWDMLAGKRVCVNVHGYKSPWGSVLTASNEILMGHASVGAKYDVCVMFAWPGSWAVASGYVLATYRAAEAGLRFRLFLEQLQEYGPLRVDVQAHSLGARVSLVALNTPEILANTLALCAGAVDSTALWDEFSTVPRTLRRVKVFHSKNDEVLKRAYRQVPWNWFSPALGYAGPTPAVQLHPMGHKIQVYDYTGIALSHSAYRDIPRFYRDLNEGI